MTATKIVYFKNSQWLVTSFGIERNDDYFEYDIEKESVHDQDWLRHMSEKNWVDIGKFYDALEFARSKWPKGKQA